MEQVGAGAGIARVTLNRWETGVFQPRLAELEAVLQALEVTPEQRERALALVEAPRAVIRQRADAGESKADLVERAGHAPAIGDLLGAMRRRRRLTLEQAAALLGVSARTMRRWESSTAALPIERLDDLCRLFGGMPEERLALSARRLWLWTPDTTGAQTLDALEQQFKDIYTQRYSLMQSQLMELHLLTLEAQIWPFAARSATARHLLAQVCAAHAHFLSDQERYNEMGVFANRALETAPLESHQEAFWFTAQIFAAHAASRRGTQLIPRRGLERFRQLLCRVQSPRQESWVLSWIGDLLVEEGAIESGLAFMDRACQAAARCDDPLIMRARESDKASVLLKIGRPGAALPILRLEPQDNPYFRTGLLLGLAEAYLGVGDVSEAQSCLQEACRNIEAHHLIHFALPAQALAKRF